MDERELLREFVEKHSEQAFAKLVARHINLVYSTALRIVGSPQTAQDVAQSVFIQLARKAGSIREGNALPGWLYRATCSIAANAVRAEKRRRERETEAMNRMEIDADTSDTQTWARIAPLLDEAMGRLNRMEQNAVVLRFFEGRSLSEVGQTLALSEDAAQKRVSRALEKLRVHFARRGMTVSSSVVVAALVAGSAQAAPAGLAANLAGASLAGIKSAGINGLAAAIKSLFATKAKVAAVSAALAVAVATPVVLQLQENARSAQAAALVRNIESAYRGLQTVEIGRELFVRDPATGKETPEGWRFRFMFDRKQNAFRSENWVGNSPDPQVTTVSDGKKIWHRNAQPLDVGTAEQKASGRENMVMEVSVPVQRDFFALAVQCPMLRGEHEPGLALLMGEGLVEQAQFRSSVPDPLRIQRIEPRPDDPLKLVGLRLSGGENAGFAPVVFWVDPQQFWINRIEHEDKSGAVVGVSKITAHIANPKLEARTFEFETRGLTVAGSYPEYIATPGSKVSNSLIGKAAPTVRLKTLDGAEYTWAQDSSKVTVVAFGKWSAKEFATQTALQKFYRWIQNTGKPVSLYAVSSGQSEESIRKLWAEAGLSIPVLMDKDAAMKGSFNVESFRTWAPRVFVIHQGRIVHDGSLVGLGSYMDLQVVVESLVREGHLQATSEPAKPPADRGIAVGMDDSPRVSMVGKPPPPIRLKRLDGSEYNLAQDESKVILVDFWTTWCGSCREGFPSLQKFHEWTKKTGGRVSLLAVNCAQTEEMAGKLWKELGLTIPVLMDKDGSVSNAFHVHALPRSFIIHQGRIVRENIPADFDTLVAVAESLLAQTGENK